MLVDKDLRVPDDTSEVGLDSDWEVRYWCARYGVSEDELRACVVQVGSRADDVERQLRKAKQQAFRQTGED
jgi:hypothetical protein